MSTLRAVMRLLVLLIYTFLTVCIAIILNRVAPYPIHRAWLRLWYSTILKLLGFSVQVTGKLPEKQGMLIVSNHSSYMDILVIGSLLPVHFTPKSTIRHWPFIAQMVGVSQPIYIDRNDRRAIQIQNQRIATAIAAGKNVVLYPEGTTSNGTCVYPFKTGFFACLEVAASPIPVLPVTITYPSCDGMMLTQNTPSPIAWYGDMTLMPHLWQLLKRSRTQVHVTVHHPVTLPGFPSRKALALDCETQIRHTLNRLFT